METPYPDAAPSPQPTDRRPAFLGSSRRFASRATPKASYGIMLRYTVHKENPICPLHPASHLPPTSRAACSPSSWAATSWPTATSASCIAPTASSAPSCWPRRTSRCCRRAASPTTAWSRSSTSRKASTTRSSAWPPKCAPRTPTACCWCWAATTATRACCRRESRAWKRPATRFPTSTSTCSTTSRRSAASTSCATSWTSPTPAPGTSTAAKTARPSCRCRTSPTR